ncbi:MAG: ASKHA domain-containing protein [Candidatus Aenigmatarchaeota archaeon]
MKDISITFHPQGKRISAPRGKTIAEIARDAGIDIRLPCGGKGLCGRCDILVNPAPSACMREKSLLSESFIQRGGRLACQCIVVSDVTVQIPVHCVASPKGTLPETKELLSRVPLDSIRKSSGIAIDLGSSMIAGYLLDGNSLSVINAISIENPQRSFGADVITRTTYIMENPEGIYILREKTLNALNDLINQILSGCNFYVDSIDSICIAGNSVMIHILFGISPSATVKPPFEIRVKMPDVLTAQELGLDIKKNTKVNIIPLSSPFIGGDIVADVAWLGIDESSETEMLIDMGTNCEILMGNKNRLLSTSSPAGPTFEGGRIRCGINAVKGAISWVYIGEDVRYGVIGNEQPVGICGSGLVDAVAELLKKGIVDETGRIRKREELEGEIPRTVASRIVEISGEPAFIISEGPENVFITQSDIREFQLAKGALRTGIEILMKEMGIRTDDIKKVYLAGSFGNYLSPDSALRTGILPELPREKIVSCGNIAGHGALLCVLSDEALKKADRIAKRIGYIHMSQHVDFQEYFLKFMNF